MSEPTQPTVETLTAELETLRKTNTELVAKNTNRKAKIAEHEATIADLTGKLTTATDTIRRVTIDGPLKQMAESISPAPELWLAEFSRAGFRLEMVSDKLTVVNADGKAIQSDGRAVPFEWQALAAFLTKGDGATAKNFKAITIASKASGAHGTWKNPTPAPKLSAAKFGLGK